MVDQLEARVKGELKEYLMSNIHDNGYANAKYRMSEETVKIGNWDVPVYMEALRNNGQWEKHPSVIIHYGTYRARKDGEGLLVLFLHGGKYTTESYSIHNMDVFKEAEEKGLTQGSTLGVMTHVKHIE